MANTGIGKILVVDDEVELKNILVEALTSQGYETSGFTSGEEALEALRGEAFDVLLTDLMMPGMDGITMVRASLQIDPHLVAIIMTGQGTIQTAVDAMKAGTFDYVLKPFRLQTVMPVLTRAMNNRHIRLENLQLRETVAIYELCQTIAFTLDQQTIISKLADAALQQTLADEVSILLPSRSSAELFVAAVRGENRQRLLGERVPLEESISGWVARQREPLILDGEIDDNRFRALWPHPEICSAIFVPMQVANKLVGIININALGRTRPFTLGQMKALTILASTAAAALESASLYSQIENQQQRLDNMVASVPGVVWEAWGEPDAANQRIDFVSGYVETMLGYSVEEWLATPNFWLTIVHPDDREEATRIAAEGFATGQSTTMEFRWLAKDGHAVWVESSWVVVKDEHGKPAGLRGVNTDISERKRAEEAVRASEAELRAVFASMTDVILVFDSEGRHLKVAPAKTKHLYVPAAERLGKTVHEVFPKDKADFFLAQIHAALAQNQTQRIEYSLEIDGEESWYDGSVSPMTQDTVVWVARDITERKQAEGALRTTQEIIEGILNAIPVRVFWKDKNLVYLGCNAAFARDAGFANPKDIIGKDDYDLAWHDQAELYRADDRQIIQSGSSKLLFEEPLVTPEGTFTLLTSKVPLRNSTGEISGILGTFMDISERKRLEEQRELLSALVQASPDFIGYADPKTAQIQYINKHGRKMCGIGEDEDLAALKISDVHPAWMNQLMTEVILPAAVRDGLWEGDGAFMDRNGREIPVSMLLLARKAANGEVDLFYTVSRDITERKRAEGALRESEERYRDLVENAHDIIFSHDLEGKYTSVNRAGQLSTGYTHEECLALNIADTIAPEHVGKAREMMAKKLAGEVGTAYEVELLAKDGKRIAVEVNTKLILQEGVPVGVQGIARDVTERKHLEDQLRQSQKMEAIGQLAGGVAHDFNNLLTAINGYSSLALQRMNGNDPIRGYLEEIKKAGDRAANLTRQLLAFGRKQILQPLALNLNDIVTDMNKLLRRLIGEDIVLTAKLDPALKKIKADPGQIEQILVNLVVNARDAMPQGGNLTIETANVELEREYVGKHVGVQPGSYVILSVSDTGTGMNDETQARIFEPFFTTKEKGKGTGLGLSTVYGIVKQSGGNIWVYSEPGQGTTFRVYLPQLLAAAKPIEKVATEAAAPGGSETILLVEDENIVRGLARKILEQSGYSVLDARGGEEAIRLCQERSEPIHLLLTDVVMPETSGREIAERLTTLRPTTRVLFMSGYTDEAIVHHGVLDSNVEFIQKPFTPMALAKKVREVLDSKRDGNGKS
jgi:two-component system, cell cycle sensor histidine kinase and response regulator CckA